MPALVNRRVGSSAGTNDEEGTSRCPLATKKSRNSRRIWADCMGREYKARRGRSLRPSQPCPPYSVDLSPAEPAARQVGEDPAPLAPCRGRSPSWAARLPARASGTSPAASAPLGRCGRERAVDDAVARPPWRADPARAAAGPALAPRGSRHSCAANAASSSSPRSASALERRLDRLGRVPLAEQPAAEIRSGERAALERPERRPEGGLRIGAPREPAAQAVVELDRPTAELLRPPRPRARRRRTASRPPRPGPRPARRGSGIEGGDPARCQRSLVRLRRPRRGDRAACRGAPSPCPRPRS